MPYQTGTFTSPADLITTIKSFCTANGWTVSGDVISKGTVFTALTVEPAGVWPESTKEMVKIVGGTGESGGGLTGASNGAAYLLGEIDNGVAEFYFPGTYWLFMATSPDSVICVVRSNEGLYFHWLIFGLLEKYGAYTGGEFFGATYHRTYGLGEAVMDAKYQYGQVGSNIRQTMAPFWKVRTASTTNVFVKSDIGVDSAVWLGESGEAYDVHFNHCMGSLISHNPNLWNNQTILSPILITTPRASGFFSLLGFFSQARFCRVTNHEPGDIITLGADKYKVFPFYFKDTVNPDGGDTPGLGAGASGTFGWAISYDGP